MDYSRPERAQRLAAEYAMGTLRGPARRRFEALLPAHPGLRQALADWEARLAPLGASIAPQDVPEAVWPRLHTRLDRKSTRLNSSHSQQSRMPSSA